MYEIHTIGDYVVPVFLIETKKKTEAAFAICKGCGAKFEKFGAPWKMSSSLWMHENGTGHKKFLYLTFKE